MGVLKDQILGGRATSIVRGERSMEASDLPAWAKSVSEGDSLMVNPNKFGRGGQIGKDG